MDVCDLKKFCTFTTVETYFLSRTIVKLRLPKIIKLQTRLLLP